jgi:hypothetical protein
MAIRRKIANGLGAVSLALFIVPLVYIAVPERFPYHSLTESLVLVGGIGGSFLSAVLAGLLGSRRWFIAVLGAALDIVALWGFSP